MDTRNHTPLKKKSTFYLNSSKFNCVDFFNTLELWKIYKNLRTKREREKNIKNKNYKKKENMAPEKRDLTDLKIDNSIVIRGEDKGGGIIIPDRDVYIKSIPHPE